MEQLPTCAWWRYYFIRQKSPHPGFTPFTSLNLEMYYYDLIAIILFLVFNCCQLSFCQN
jgi:hypothetical protein